MNDLISINLTTFNRCELLPRAINGVLEQTYQNWELIIVDDHSQDDTQNILQDYRKKDKRIKVFRHPHNKGNAQARNTALKNSRGKYIAFLDDDDQWVDRNKLKKQIKVFDDSIDPRLAIVCTSVNIIDSQSRKTAQLVKAPSDLNKHILGGNGIIYSPTVLTKRSLMTAVGGFDKSMVRGVDSEFYRTCIIKFNLKVYFLPDITTNIYEHKGSRLTPVKTFKSVKISMKTNLYLLSKYFYQYLKNPKIAMKRLRNIILSPAIYLKQKLVN